MGTNNQSPYDATKQTIYEQFVAAECCYRSFLKDKDDLRPIKLLKEDAQNNNNPWAIVKLAKCYIISDTSHDWQIDYEKCIALLDELPNFPLAIITLAEVLISLKSRKKRVKKLLNRALEIEHTRCDAHYLLGNAYMLGDFFKQKFKKAKMHLEKARNLGHPEAAKVLKKLKKQQKNKRKTEKTKHFSIDT